MQRKTTLDNGLRIVTNEMPHMQSVALGIWIKAGSRFETESNNGIAHFLEHIVFKGTKKYSCYKIKETVEGLGGALNGFTSEEHCCYLVKLPYRYLNLALAVLSDMVINPLLSEQDINREKSVILEEIKMYQDLPQSYVQELLGTVLWPKHPLGRSILGTSELIRNFKRQDFVHFKESYYTAGNIVVSACGNLKHDHFQREVGRLFKRLKKSNLNQPKRVLADQKKPGFNLYAKDTGQTHFNLGFHGLSKKDPARYALRLLHIILGANMSSRLFNEVREKKGLAYEIGTQVKHFSDTGTFAVHAGVDNKHLRAALKVILKELGRIKKDLVSDGEIKRAKEFFIGQLSLSLEDTLDHMFLLGESVISLNKTFTLDEIVKKIKMVKREDIRSLGRRLFRKDNINLALIGPAIGESEQKRIYECLSKN